MPEQNLYQLALSRDELQLLYGMLLLHMNVDLGQFGMAALVSKMVYRLYDKVDIDKLHNQMHLLQGAIVKQYAEELKDETLD